MISLYVQLDGTYAGNLKCALNADKVNVARALRHIARCVELDELDKISEVHLELEGQLDLFTEGLSIQM